MKKKVVIFLAVWLICGIFNTGAYYAHLQNEYPSTDEWHRKENVILALCVGTMGPVGTIVEAVAEIITTGTFLKHGWQLPPLSAFK